MQSLSRHIPAYVPPHTENELLIESFFLMSSSTLNRCTREGYDSQTLHVAMQHRCIHTWFAVLACGQDILPVVVREHRTQWVVQIDPDAIFCMSLGSWHFITYTSYSQVSNTVHVYWVSHFLQCCSSVRTLCIHVVDIHHLVQCQVHAFVTCSLVRWWLISKWNFTYMGSV